MKPEEFINSVKELGISLTDTMLNNLEIYAKYLIEYNQHTNLTAITDIKLIYLKHFYDSLTFFKAINPSEFETLLDIGTGAGFPGMVLKIVFPNLEVTLLDSNNKKINFLKELTMKLNLTKVNFFHGRAEEFCIKNREKFDIVTARAVSNMTVLTELCLPLTKVGGYFIAMKGSNVDEITEAKNAITKLGGKVERIVEFTLPSEEIGRNIVKILKEKTTPKEYPRRYEKIVKSPLK